MLMARLVTALSLTFVKKKDKVAARCRSFVNLLGRLKQNVVYFVLPVRKPLSFRCSLSHEQLRDLRARLQKVLQLQQITGSSSHTASRPAKRDQEEKASRSSPYRLSDTVKKWPAYFSSYLKMSKEEVDVNDKVDLAARATRARPRIHSKSAVDVETLSLIRLLRLSTHNDEVVLRRMEKLCLHLYEYPWAQGLSVRQRTIGVILTIRQRSQLEALTRQCDEALGLLGYHDPLPTRGIRILSIDGGGMRGIIALEVLKAIEHYTGKKIFQLFDLICGVSTGAIIAALLGFHRQSIRDIEHTYNTIGFKIFRQNMLDGARGWVWSHSYYNTDLYEKVLKSFVGECYLTEALRLPHRPKVAIVSTLVNDIRAVPYVFRSYIQPYRTQSNYKGCSDVPIWAAVRASSAAPGYFNDFLFKGMVHQDGGILTNNATHIAIHEATRIWPGERLQCVVSLGLGRYEGANVPLSHSSEPNRPSNKPLSLAQKFSRIIDSATDTELVHETLHDLLPGQVYYRFNPYLSEYCSLDETRTDKFRIMREATSMYLRRNEDKVLDACAQLLLPRWPSVRLLDTAKQSYVKLMASDNVATDLNRWLQSDPKA